MRLLRSLKLKESDFTAGYIGSILNYNPESGLFTWKVRRGSRAMPGKRAGSVLWNGYRAINVDGCHLREHRLAWLLVHGSLPVEDIDHVNGQRSDNRLCNLRSVSRQENCRNLARRSDNSSGVPGVSFHKKLGKWRSYISTDGKQINLGVFESLAGAIDARKAAEVKLGFHKNHGRAAA